MGIAFIVSRISRIVQYLSQNACLGRQGTEAIGWRNRDDNWSEETRFVFVLEAKLEMMVMKIRMVVSE